MLWPFLVVLLIKQCKLAPVPSQYVCIGEGAQVSMSEAKSSNNNRVKGQKSICRALDQRKMNLLSECLCPQIKYIMLKAAAFA